MDVLQVALVFLILLLGCLLSILGMQVFFILRDLKKSLDKIDLLLGDARGIAENIQKPLQTAANISSAVETGVEVAKALGDKIIHKKEKPAKRMFKTR